MTAPAPSFGRGGDAAKAESDAGGGTKFPRVEYFSLDNGDSIFLRFVTDSPEWYYTKQHPSVPTKNKPEWFTGNWPKGMPAVCRHDKAFTGIYTDCYVCDAPVMNPREPNKKLGSAVRVWALAVERKQVFGDGSEALGGEARKGKLVGYADATKEVTIPGKDGADSTTVTQKKLLVVNMGVKNFFGNLQALYSSYGSIVDRDFEIKRSGEGLKTEYSLAPLDRTPGHAPGTPSWDRLLQAVQDQNLDLEAIIAEKASDEYFALFFDPNKTPTERGKGNGSSSNGAAPVSTAKAETPAVASIEEGPSPDRLAAMREKLQAGNTVAPAPAPATADTGLLANIE